MLASLSFKSPSTVEITVVPPSDPAWHKCWGTVTLNSKPSGTIISMLTTFCCRSRGAPDHVNQSITNGGEIICSQTESCLAVTVDASRSHKQKPRLVIMNHNHNHNRNRNLCRPPIPASCPYCAPQYTLSPYLNCTPLHFLNYLGIYQPPMRTRPTP